jgi:hypothetical protein
MTPIRHVLCSLHHHKAWTREHSKYPAQGIERESNLFPCEGLMSSKLREGLVAIKRHSPRLWPGFQSQPDLLAIEALHLGFSSGFFFFWASSGFAELELRFCKFLWGPLGLFEQGFFWASSLGLFRPFWASSKWAQPAGLNLPMPISSELGFFKLGSLVWHWQVDILDRYDDWMQSSCY